MRSTVVTACYRRCHSCQAEAEILCGYCCNCGGYLRVLRGYFQNKQPSATTLGFRFVGISLFLSLESTRGLLLFFTRGFDFFLACHVSKRRSGTSGIM